MEEDDLEALDNVAHGPCACGYKWPSCVLPTHALVLDALAECLDKAEQHLSAFSTALSTIRLNSRSAIVSLVRTRSQNKAKESCND